MPGLSSMSTPDAAVQAPSGTLTRSGSLRLLLLWAEGGQPPPRAPRGPPPHLLQRPWAGCALLLTEAGREHLWHTHSFPLKVTRSPGGKGILQRGTASPARTLTPPGGGGPLARHMPSAPLGAHAQAPQAEDRGCSTQA